MNKSILNIYERSGDHEIGSTVVRLARLAVQMHQQNEIHEKEEAATRELERKLLAVNHGAAQR